MNHNCCGGETVFMLLNNVLDIKGVGVGGGIPRGSPPTVGIFFIVLKPGFGCIIKIININSSSQCMIAVQGVGAVSVDTKGEGVGGGPSDGCDFLGNWGSKLYKV